MPRGEGGAPDCTRLLQPVMTRDTVARLAPRWWDDEGQCALVGVAGAQDHPVGLDAWAVVVGRGARGKQTLAQRGATL